MFYTHLFCKHSSVAMVTKAVAMVTKAVAMVTKAVAMISHCLETEIPSKLSPPQEQDIEPHIGTCLTHVQLEVCWGHVLYTHDHTPPNPFPCNNFSPAASNPIYPFTDPRGTPRECVPLQTSPLAYNTPSNTLPLSTRNTWRMCTTSDTLPPIHEEHLENVYHFRHRSVEPLHSMHRRDVTETLNSHHMSDPDLPGCLGQRALPTNYLPPPPQVRASEQDEVLQLHKRSASRSRGHQGSRKREEAADEVVETKKGGDTPNDPNWADEWFILSLPYYPSPQLPSNTIQRLYYPSYSSKNHYPLQNSEDSGAWVDYQYNINVQPAWDKGYNGTGVVVCVIDDGLEKGHLDLIDNYDPLASYDMQDDDNDPSPPP
eukprot:sb/3465809/